MISSRSAGFLFAVLLCAACVSFCGRTTTGESSATPPAGETTTATQVAEKPAAQAQPSDTKPAAEDAAQQAADDEKYAPETATGAVKGVPAPTNTAPIVAVANFFTDLPGFDLSTMDQHSREKFLHRVNSELCTCGCKNDTLARCLVNDPKCPVVKTLVQKVYDEVNSGR